MKILNYIFRQKLAFEPIDPLGDGLREMIESEQRSPYAIRLDDDDFSAGNFWRDINQGE